jgi:REP element-mobilizing transposase RayT
MLYNPDIHHRRSIRLQGYDYSQTGLYFVTICVQNRKYMFGHVSEGKMVLNDAGRMIEKWCAELSNKFPDIELDEYVIMPNHFHAIIINTGTGRPDGDEHVRAHLCVRPDNNTRPDNNNILGEHVGSPLHAVVQWFKTMTTNEYIRGVKTLNWRPFDKKLWQRNYYEHIIRNADDYARIAGYIVSNPVKWANDTFYSKEYEI